MDIEIETRDKLLIFDLLGKNSANNGETVSVSGDATLRYKRTMIFKSMGVPDLIEISISFSGGMTSSLVSAWLYDKLKGKADKIRINRREIELDKDEIKKIIEEEVRIIE